MAAEISDLRRELSRQIEQLTDISTELDNAIDSSCWRCYKIKFFRDKILDPSRKFEHAIIVINGLIKTLNFQSGKNYPLLDLPNYAAFLEEEASRSYINAMQSRYGSISEAAKEIYDQLNPNQTKYIVEKTTCSDIICGIFLIVFGVCFMFRSTH